MIDDRPGTIGDTATFIHRCAPFSRPGNRRLDTATQLPSDDAMSSFLRGFRRNARSRCGPSRTPTIMMNNLYIVTAC